MNFVGSKSGDYQQFPIVNIINGRGSSILCKMDHKPVFEERSLLYYSVWNYSTLYFTLSTQVHQIFTCVPWIWKETKCCGFLLLHCFNSQNLFSLRSGLLLASFYWCLDILVWRLLKVSGQAIWGWLFMEAFISYLVILQEDASLALALHQNHPAFNSPKAQAGLWFRS